MQIYAKILELKKKISLNLKPGLMGGSRCFEIGCLACVDGWWMVNTNLTFFLGVAKNEILQETKEIHSVSAP